MKKVLGYGCAIWLGVSAAAVVLAAIFGVKQPTNSPTLLVKPIVTVYARVITATPQSMPIASMAPSATPLPTDQPTEAPPIAPPVAPTLEIIEVLPAPVVEQPARLAQPAEAQPVETAPIVVAQGNSYPCQPGQIKANGESRIYHVPGGALYDKTRNDSVICFDTEQQAIDAGYVRSKR